MTFFDDMTAAIDSAPKGPATPAEVPAPAGHNVYTELPARIQSAAAKVQEQGDTASQTLDALQAVTQAVQTARTSSLATAVDAKSAIREQVVENTTGLLDRAKPLFAKKAAISAREEELANMNPIKSAILGVFNRNYNQRHLDHESAIVNDGIQGVNQEYSTINTLQDRMFAMIDQKHTGEEAVNSLLVDNANQNFQIAGMQLQQTRGKMADLLNDVSSQGALAETQMKLTEKAIAEASPVTLNAAIQAADRTGGVTMLGGAQVSKQQLKTRLQQIESQDLALSSQRLSNQAQKLNLSEAASRLMMSHMSYTDVQTALNNNGVFRGVQLDQAQLGQRLGNLTQGIGELAGANSGVVGARSAASLAGMWADNMEGMLARVKGVSGPNVPPALMQSLAYGSQQIHEIAETSKTLKNPQERQRYLASAGSKIIELIQSSDGVASKLAAGMTTDSNAQLVIKGWITGVAPTQEQSVNGIRALIKGGSLPPGMKLSGGAAAGITASQAALQGLEKTQEYKDASEPEKAAMERKAITTTMAAQFNGYHIGKVTDAIPALAERAGHPMGVSNEQYAAARAAGDSDGLRVIGGKLGYTESQMKALFAPGKAGDEMRKQPMYATGENGQKHEVSLQDVQGMVLAAQTSGWMRNLDAIQPGASRAMSAFLSSSQGQGAIGAYADGVGHTGFGESLANAAGGNSLRQKFTGMAEQIKAATTANAVAGIQKQTQVYQLYKNDPFVRIETAIASNPDISEADARNLTSAIRQSAAKGGSIDDTFTDAMGVLKGSKFENPALERVRKIAAKDIEKRINSVDNSLDYLHRAGTSAAGIAPRYLGPDSPLASR